MKTTLAGQKQEMTEWRQQGRVFFWRYHENTRNYPGGHLTADDRACRSLHDLLTRLIDCKHPRKQLVRITRPTDEVLSTSNDRDRWSAPDTLEIATISVKERENFWDCQSKGQHARISAGRAKLAELRDGIGGIPKGVDDYAMGPDDGTPEEARWNDVCLWFWRMPESKSERVNGRGHR